MISNVKSKYILAKIFEVLPFKLQLLLIKHNKSLQKKLNITLETYMEACGKRVEINGDYGKEYLIKEEILIFEGQYNLMKRHGHGKELYSNGKIQFDGEYLNGRRWNGQTYTFNGIKEFDIINGEGYIREYNIHGIKTYEGDIVNGIKEGFGKDFSQGKIEYEGIFKNGKREVEGVEYYSNGRKEYEGGYLGGERNGKGKEYDFDDNLKYDGDYSVGFWNGQGKEYHSGKLVFSGYFKWGKRWNGIGYDNYGNKIYELKNGCGIVKEYNEDGILLYDGEYKNGVKYGLGKEYNIEKELIYDGSYINGKRSKGKGKEYNFSGRLKYEGEYLNGEWHGNGTEYESNGEISFEGVFKNGKRWKGKGKEYFSFYKIQFKGEYANGEKNGQGVEYAPNGSIIFEGEYFQNKRWNGIFNEITQYGNKKFEGNLKNGMKNGHGKEYINGEWAFEGEYLDDKKWKGKGREPKKEGDGKTIILVTYEKGEKKYP
jgi:antitoxin component YwqK of YwqJK toxin-antitoxin module